MAVFDRIVSTPTRHRIQPLSETLINQIAAGEVVERPASVVKELLENSLDAASTRVDIALEDGGMKSIVIQDNGIGMDRENLLLCAQRHATSKLQQFSDLEKIATFGFRGEALSSITSVATVEIQSRPQGSVKGLRLKLSFGRIEEGPTAIGMPEGTQISVRGIFDQLPARKKFLRSNATELSHCARVVRETALANPDVCFFFHHQGKLLFSFVAPTREKRFHEVLGPKWKPMPVTAETDGIALEAYLSPPTVLSDRGDLLLFINQRPVRNRGLLMAVRQAYLSSMGPHHEPSGVVYLELAPGMVDVNVHPQKTEVRCHRQESVFSWLQATIRKALGTMQTIREVSLPMRTSHEVKIAEPRAPYSLPPKSPKVFEEKRDTSSATLIEEPAFALQEKLPEPQFKYLGQVAATYLVCEDSDGLVLIDQHAIHEKMRYEALIREFEEGALHSQKALIPKVLRFLPEEAQLLAPVINEVFRLGFEIEPFGQNEIALKAFPALIGESQAEQILRDIVAEAQDEHGQGIKDVFTKNTHRLLATMACHSVVRANQALSTREAFALIEGLKSLESGWTCPHGRPVIFRINYGDIEKFFQRC